jgi:hypothetical protein
MFYILLELEFHRASNGTDSTSKFLLSRRESLTQVDVQNLLGCCVTVRWAVGPCTVLKPVRIASRELACSNFFLFSSRRYFRVRGFCLDSFYHQTVSPFIDL